MDLKRLQVLALHKYPQYLRPCCELINTEWPRSETARMMSLQASCDELPTSLILINDQKHLLGHCKLTPIPNIPNSCFIETVVISKSHRGKGLGTYLMKEVEKYCKNVLKLAMVHLSTKGQEDFYAKLGYEICAPICIYGSSISNYSTSAQDNDALSVPINIVNVVNNNVPAPPPPPPPPPMLKAQTNSNTMKSNRTYMFKSLSE